jgi:hypothetical protein
MTTVMRLGIWPPKGNDNKQGDWGEVSRDRGYSFVLKELGQQGYIGETKE